MVQLCLVGVVIGRKPKGVCFLAWAQQLKMESSTLAVGALIK